MNLLNRILFIHLLTLLSVLNVKGQGDSHAKKVIRSFLQTTNPIEYVSDRGYAFAFIRNKSDSLSGLVIIKNTSKHNMAICDRVMDFRKGDDTLDIVIGAVHVTLDPMHEIVSNFFHILEPNKADSFTVAADKYEKYILRTVIYTQLDLIVTQLKRGRKKYSEVVRNNKRGFETESIWNDDVRLSTEIKIDSISNKGNYPIIKLTEE